MNLQQGTGKISVKLFEKLIMEITVPSFSSKAIRASFPRLHFYFKVTKITNKCVAVWNSTVKGKKPHTNKLRSPAVSVLMSQVDIPKDQAAVVPLLPWLLTVTRAARAGTLCQLHTPTHWECLGRRGNTPEPQPPAGLSSPKHAPKQTAQHRLGNCLPSDNCL